MEGEKLKQEMLASTNQYTNFVETEAEGQDAYRTALDTNESKYLHIITRIKCIQCLSIVPKKMQDATKELEQLLASGKITNVFGENWLTKSFACYREPKSQDIERSKCAKTFPTSCWYGNSNYRW